MGYEERNVRTRKPAVGEDFLYRLSHCAHRYLEGFISLHLEIRGLGFGHGFFVERAEWRRRRRATGKFARRVEHLPVTAVGMYAGREYAAFAVRGAEYRGPGAVSEKHARGAVFPVHYGREKVHPYDEGVFYGSALYVFIGYVNGKEESRARGRNVERRYAGSQPQFVLNEARYGRENHVGRYRAGYDEVYVFRVQARRLEGELCGLYRHVRGFLAARYAALLDACSFSYPMVSGVDEFCQVVIGHDGRRHVTAAAYELAF